MLNTVVITLQTETYTNVFYDWYFAFLDNIFLGVYTIETVLKYIVYRRAFFKSGWNVFDLFIVVVSYVDYVQYIFAEMAVDLQDTKLLRVLRIFRALRAIRALRALRAISFLKELQVIVRTLLRSIPAMGSIVLLLSLVLYIFAIIGVEQFSTTIPQRFGSLGDAVFTLFQLLTLDDWFSIYDDARASQGGAIWFLIVFIILETFIFINLFIAVIVNNLEAAQRQQKRTKALRAKKKREERERIAAEKRMGEEKTRRESQNADQNAHGSDPDGEVRPLDEILPGTARLPERVKQLIAYYFMLLASTENSLSQHAGHQNILDSLVDLTVDVDDDD